MYSGAHAFDGLKETETESHLARWAAAVRGESVEGGTLSPQKSDIEDGRIVSKRERNIYLTTEADNDSKLYLCAQQ